MMLCACHHNLINIICDIRTKAKELISEGVVVIPVIIGDQVTPDHIILITDEEDRIQICEVTDPPETIAKKIDDALKKALTGE
jgi:hypothetical protein